MSQFLKLNNSLSRVYMHSVGCISQENPDLEDRGLPSLGGFGRREDLFFLWCQDGVVWLFSKFPILLVALLMVLQLETADNGGRG